MHGTAFNNTEIPLIEKLDGIDLIYQDSYSDYD